MRNRKCVLSTQSLTEQLQTIGCIRAGAEKSSQRIVNEVLSDWQWELLDNKNIQKKEISAPKQLIRRCFHTLETSSFSWQYAFLEMAVCSDLVPDLTDSDIKALSLPAKSGLAVEFIFAARSLEDATDKLFNLESHACSMNYHGEQRVVAKYYFRKGPIEHIALCFLSQSDISRRLCLLLSMIVSSTISATCFEQKSSS